MKFSLTKLKAAFGNPHTMEKLHEDTFIEAIIQDIEEVPFAKGTHNVCYAGLNELGGYHFLQTIIVGTFHIKTLKGAQLTITGHDFEMKLNSDMVELESDYSNVSNRSITRIDFPLETEDLGLLKKSQIKKPATQNEKAQYPF